jgi:Cdc6-like AAA superfamily ATPase
MNDYQFERKLIEDSGIEDVFRPNKPVRDDLLFGGRTEQLKKIWNCLHIGGYLILIYGERGVGKTSLALSSCYAFKKTENKKIVRFNCSRDTTFKILSKSIFENLDIDYHNASITSGCSWSCKFWGSERKKTEMIERDIDNPSWVYRMLLNQDCVIILDEFDTIINEKEKEKVSQLMKHLSDSESKISLVVVGISKDADSLLNGHKSILRCLQEIPLDKMTQKELEEIIEIGEERTGLSFETKVKQSIARISCGYPFFTHLLAYKSAEKAVKERRIVVSNEDLEVAMDIATNDVLGTLKKQYHKVIKSNKNKTIYEKILLAASINSKDGFLTKDSLWKTFKQMDFATNNTSDVNSRNFNNYLAPIVSRRNDTILKSDKRGVYVFNDPRMPGFIRLAQKYTE